VQPTDPNAITGGFHPPYKDSPAGPDPFYFGYTRPEILALVPESAQRVLDIGCGAGRLGEALKALRSRCQFFFEHGEPAEAENAIKVLIEHDPDDASAHHNLSRV